MSRKMMSKQWHDSSMDSIIQSRRSPTSNPTPTSSSSCIKQPRRNVKCKMTSSTPSTHARHTASPTIKLQQPLQHLHQPSLLQATTTSQITRKLRQVQVVFLLLQATSSRVLLRLLRPMRPSRQVPSSVSLAEAEATSPTSAPTSEPWSSTTMALMTP